MANFLGPMPKGKIIQRTETQQKAFIAAVDRINNKMEEVRAESALKDYNAKLSASTTVINK